MLKYLTEQIKYFNASRNWQKYHNPKDVAIGVSLEASELLKLFQWIEPKDSYEVEDIIPFEDEVADIMIYLLNFCDILGINLEQAIKNKLEKNSKRFPK